MATNYTLNFTDTSKTPFTISEYSADGPRSPSDPLFMDRAVRASTTLKLYGKGSQNYGEGMIQNLVYLLENFSSNSEPVYPIEGQLWYKNGAGSPPTNPELKIRNGSGSWDSVILSTGSSEMTGLLTLGGDPVDPLHAATKQYVDSGGSALGTHIADQDVHLTTSQNTFLDNLTITYIEANHLSGVTSSVQTQLDSSLKRSGDTLDVGANLTLQGGGEIFGLPATPSTLDAAASRQYVDNQLGSGAGGDGVLTTTAWVAGVGTVGSVNDNILELTVTYPVGAPTVFAIEGISRVGHAHDASEIVFDNTSYPAYPTEIQSAVEWIETTKAPSDNPTLSGTVNVTGGLILSHDPTANLEAATKQYVDSVAGGGSGGPGTSAVIDREIYQSIGGSPVERIYQIQPYEAASNSLFVYVNGVKQYGSTYNGKQTVSYDDTVVTIDSLSSTYLDPLLNYHFNITVDGVGPTLITLTAGTPISTHGTLVTAINDQLTLAGLDATFSILDTATETFNSLASGSSASVVLADPGSPGTYNYLFNVPTPLAISRPEFVGVFTDPDPANWTIPDNIVIAGDVTADFPAGKSFTIRGSQTDYGPYDGVYTVYSTGATYDGSTETTIPVASSSDYTQPIPLIYDYSTAVGGSPAPSVPVVSQNGSVYLTFLGGLIGLNTPVTGIDGSYREVIYAGSPLTLVTAPPGTTTDLIEFTYDIPAGQLLEVNIFN